MDNLITLAQRLQELPREIPRMLQEIFQEIAPIAEDLNIRQLQHGQRADGTFLPDYSPVSVAVFGKPPGPIRLFDQGDFYRGITLKVTQQGVDMIGLDVKTEDLVKRFGEEILGLSEESLEELKEGYILELLGEKILKYLSND